MPKVPGLKTLNHGEYIYSPIAPHKRSVSPTQAKILSAGRLVDDTTINNHDSTGRTYDMSTLSSSMNTHQDIQYPLNARERYRTPEGKTLTKYQWDVYDFILKIPKGYVTTYKIVAQAVGGSPRSAGNALRNNPFSPIVPCHRIVASNLFIGGFFGEWAGRRKSCVEADSAVANKVKLLKNEGVNFNERGFIIGGERHLWKPEIF